MTYNTTVGSTEEKKEYPVVAKYQICHGIYD